MSSLYGYVNRETQQMSASFNFTDLYHDPTPDEIYERQPRCWRSSMAAKGGRYRPMPANYTGCARTEPYEPIIKIPMEVRALDSEWAECNGGIEGVYDPPSESTMFGKGIYKITDALPTVALTPTDAMVVPTRSHSHISTSSAAPASSPFSNQTPETTQAKPPNSTPTGSGESSVQGGAADNSVRTQDRASLNAPKTTQSRGNNVWPLPPTDPELPDTTDALSVLRSAQASAEAARIAASLVANAAVNQPEGSRESGVPSAHHNADSNDSIDPTVNEPVRSAQASVVWTKDSEVFTAILADGSAKIQGAGDSATVTNGNEVVFRGQKIQVSPEGDRIQVDGVVLNPDPIEDTADAEGSNKQGNVVFQASGRTITAIPQDGSLVLQVEEATTSVAYGENVIFAGNTLSLPSSDNSAINVNGQRVTVQSLGRSSNNLVPSSTVWIDGSETFTAMMQSGSTILLEAAGTSRHMTAGSIVTLGDAVFSMPYPGGVLVHDGTSITLNGAAVTDPADDTVALGANSDAITALDSGESVIVEMEDKTFTLADGSRTTCNGRVISVDSTGGAIAVDGTATVGVSSHSAAVLSSGSSDAGGGEESTATPMDIQSVGCATHSTMKRATLIPILGLLAIALR